MPGFPHGLEVGLTIRTPVPAQDWLPLLAAGATFVSLGAIKLYGLANGIVGGAGAPLRQRLCGS